MNEGEVTARVLITILSSMSIVVGFPAALSALHKWRRNKREVEAWDQQLEQRVAKKNELFVRRVSIYEDTSLTYQEKQVAGDVLTAEWLAYLDDRGWKGGSLTLLEEKGVMDARPARMFQAPVEVCWGLFAVACGVAASIWDVWLA